MTEGHRSAVETLAASHAHLKEVVAAAAAATDPSYCSEWTIAQVLSHLGSGAEIGLLNLNAALAGGPPPERDLYLAIWDVWNAKSPEAQAADSLVSDAAYISTWESLDDAALDALRVPMMGRELDASGLRRDASFRACGSHLGHRGDERPRGRRPPGGDRDVGRTSSRPDRASGPRCQASRGAGSPRGDDGRARGALRACRSSPRR